MDKICDIEQLAALVDRIHEAHSQLRMTIDKPSVLELPILGTGSNRDRQPQQRGVRALPAGRSADQQRSGLGFGEQHVGRESEGRHASS